MAEADPLESNQHLHRLQSDEIVVRRPTPSRKGNRTFCDYLNTCGDMSPPTRKDLNIRPRVNPQRILEIQVGANRLNDVIFFSRVVRPKHHEPLHQVMLMTLLLCRVMQGNCRRPAGPLNIDRVVLLKAFQHR